MRQCGQEEHFIVGEHVAELRGHHGAARAGNLKEDHTQGAHVVVAHLVIDLGAEVLVAVEGYHEHHEAHAEVDELAVVVFSWNHFIV